MERIRKFFNRRVAPAPVDVEELLQRKKVIVNNFVEENIPTLVMLEMAYPEKKEIKDTLKVLREIKVANKRV